MIKMSPTAQRATIALWPIWLLAAMALGTAVAMWLWFWTPAGVRLAQAQALHAQAKTVQAKQAAIRRTEESLQKVWSELPLKKDFPSLIMSVSELAQQRRVKIPGMSYELETLEQGLALKAAIQFRATGDYRDIRRFIHSLETAGPYVFVESLDVSNKMADPNSAGVSFNVKLITYLRPAAKPSADEHEARA